MNGLFNTVLHSTSKLSEELSTSPIMKSGERPDNLAGLQPVDCNSLNGPIGLSATLAQMSLLLDSKNPVLDRTEVPFNKEGHIDCAFNNIGRQVSARCQPMDEYKHSSSALRTTGVLSSASYYMSYISISCAKIRSSGSHIVLPDSVDSFVYNVTFSGLKSYVKSHLQQASNFLFEQRYEDLYRYTAELMSNVIYLEQLQFALLFYLEVLDGLSAKVICQMSIEDSIINPFNSLRNFLRFVPLDNTTVVHTIKQFEKNVVSKVKEAVEAPNLLWCLQNPCLCGSSNHLQCQFSKDLGALFARRYGSEEMRDLLTPILDYAIGISQLSLTSQQQSDFRKSLWAMPLLSVNIRKQDSKLGTLQHQCFFYKLYHVRAILKVQDDFGFKDRIVVSEGPEEKVGSFSLWDLFKSRKEDKPFNLKETISSAFSKVFSFFSFISNSIKKFFFNIEVYLVKKVYNLIDPLDLMKGMHLDQDRLYRILGTIVTIFLLLLVVSGVLGTVVGRMIYRSIFSSEVVAEYRSNNLDDNVQDYFSLMEWAFPNLKSDGLEAIRRRALQLTALAAGGTILYNWGRHILCLLPEGLRTATLYSFGSEVQILQHQYDEWRIAANALISLQKTTSVMASNIYHERIRDLLKNGSALFPKLIKIPDLRVNFATLYFQLSKLMININSFEYAPTDRDLPYSIHLSAPPGVGKTLLAPMLVAAITQLPKSAIYEVPLGDEYWSGFLNHLIIIMDEFLIGHVQETKEKLAKLYLGLCSTGIFQPPLASVADINVGVKGTTCRPDLVMTMSNEPYDTVVGINNTALWRRRHHVIEIESLNVGASANIDFTSMTINDIQNASWAKFRIIPAEFDQSVMPSPWMNFRTLCTVLRENYVAHKEVCHMVNEATRSQLEANHNADPQVIIDNLMRETYGLKTTPLTLSGYLRSFLPDFLVKSEGPQIKKVRHVCCNVEHWSPLPCIGFTCKQCKTRCDCPAATEDLTYAKVLAVGDDQAYMRDASGKKRDLSSPTGAIRELITPRPTMSSTTVEDILPYDDHYNFSTNSIHKHNCAEPTCARIVLHRHDDAKHPPIFCPYHCKSDNVFVFEDQLKNSHDGEYIHTEYNTLRLANLSMFADEALRLYCVNPYMTPQEHHANMAKTPVFRAIGLLITFFVGFYFVKFILNLVKPKDSERITIIAESDPPRHEARSKGRRLPRFGAEGPSVTPKLEFNGMSVNVIPICERFIMTFYHGIRKFVKSLTKPTLLQYKSGGVAYDVILEQRNFIISEEADVVFIDLENAKVPKFKDIRRNFITEDELFVMDKLGFKMTVDNKEISGTLSVNGVMVYSHDDISIRLDNHYKYYVLTQNGFCGTPLIATTGPYKDKYLGMHVAGSLSKIGSAFGVGTIITQEVIEMALPKVTSEGDGFDVITGPNLVKKELVPIEERVHLHRKTKLRPSVLSGEVTWGPRKEYPLLSEYDARANGDPVVNMVNNTLQVTWPDDYDKGLIDSIYKDILLEHESKLHFPLGKRQLTFTEAVAGVPGKLKSMKMSTSPGFPHVLQRGKRSGKKDFFEFDRNGDLVIYPGFEDKVLNMKKDMENGIVPEFYYLAYLKDEPMTPEKVREGRTRIIYSGEIISSVVFRMKLGAVLAAYNSIESRTPSVIGLNQYSHDMHSMWLRLVEVGENFIAGDYKGFDKTTHPYFRMKSYGIICELAQMCGVELKFLSAFKQHQMFSMAQVLDFRFQTVCNHMSGCVVTTPINNINNEAYFRYVFAKIYPMKVFRDNIRMICLGDDHVVSVKDGLVKFNPIEIAKVMKIELGQTYTSAFKDQPLSPEFSKFEDIMFLGARPRMILGKWAGALRKESIEESLLWTRNYNLTIKEEIVQMMEMCSLWPQDYYNRMLATITAACDRVGLDRPNLISYSSLQRVVVNRTAASGESHLTYGVISEGDELPAISGLTTFHDDSESKASTSMYTRHALGHRSIKEEAFPITKGTDSYIRRGQFNWTSAQPAGTIIFSVQSPWGILALSDQNNTQNMPFDRMSYVHTDVELKFLLIGNQFKQGLLAIYFFPLSTGFTSLLNLRAHPHQFLSPNMMTSAEMRIPYCFPRAVLNTNASGQSDEVLGTFHVVVVSPLVSVDGAPVTITMYSRFPNAKFSIPRPPPGTVKVESDKVVGQGFSIGGNLGFNYSSNDRPNKISNNFNDQGFNKPKSTTQQFSKILRERMLRKEMGGGRRPMQSQTQVKSIAEGQSFSTTNVSNTNVFSNIAGSCPVEESVGGSTADTSDALDLKIPDIPMDRPWVTGSTVPIHQSHPSMSQVVGPIPSTAMQMVGTAAFRDARKMFNAEETSIESLVGVPSLIHVIDWNTSQVQNTELLSFGLNSVLGTTVGITDPVPLFMGIWNCFLYWRADIVLEFQCVRTTFHNGRINMITAYATPSILAGSENAYYNQVLPFYGDKYVQKVVIEYNQATPYLDTFNLRYRNPTQDSSLGFIKLMVDNQLSAPATVPASVQILVWASLQNGSFAVPRPYVPFRSGGDYPLISFTPTRKDGVDGVVAEADGIGENVAPDEPELVTAIGVTKDQMPAEIRHPCQLDLGKHFEFVPVNLIEIMRRMNDMTNMDNITSHSVVEEFADGSVRAYGIHTFVRPTHVFARLFAGWSGGFRYKFLTCPNGATNDIQAFVSYVPVPTLERSYVIFNYPSQKHIEVDIDNPGIVLTTLGQSPFNYHLNQSATEVTYALFTNSFIDVTVPYQSKYSFIDSEPSLDSCTGNDIGIVSLYTRSPDVTSAGFTRPTKFQIFQAVSDDFSMGLRRIPSNLTWCWSDGVPPVNSWFYGLRTP